MANIPHIENVNKTKGISVYHNTVYKEHSLRVLCHYGYAIYCPLNLNLRGLL